MEHLWRPCHLRAPGSALKQGDWEGGGQAHRAVPKLSLFITATEMGRGRQVARPLVPTYCDHLLLHCVGVRRRRAKNSRRKKKDTTCVFERRREYLMFDL